MYYASNNDLKIEGVYVCTLIVPCEEQTPFTRGLVYLPFHRTIGRNCHQIEFSGHL
jgi:hypothetical protein